MSREDAEAERDIFASAVRQAAEAIVITDPDGTIQSVNEAFERMSGYLAAEVVGTNPRVLKSGAQDRAFYRELWSTIREGGIWTGRLMNRRKDGTHYYVDSTISPLRGPDGRVTRFLAFQKDITREVELERQLHAVQRLESVGQLAAGVAHDFNNLMTVILSNAEVELADSAEASPLRSALQDIKDAALAGRSLTKQLLAFSRQQLLRPHVIDLGAMVRKSEKMLRRVLGGDIDLRVRVAPDMANVRADPVHIESVILNLALNARDAMPDGGILTLDASQVTIDETYAETHAEARPGRFVLLTVTDTGIGMDEATRERIFEPFFTTKETGRGSGMGLAMVYGTVKQSDGNIWVYSEPGSGTTFKIYLPAVDQPAEAPAERAPVAQLRGEGRILLVEDNDAVRRSVRRILERSGYTVQSEADPAAAVQRIGEPAVSFDLLLTDVVMPGMNGLELAERAAGVRPDLRVLFVSGHSADVAFRGGVPTLEHAFLEKPFTADELTGKVRELMGEA